MSRRKDGKREGSKQGIKQARKVRVPPRGGEGRKEERKDLGKGRKELLEGGRKEERKG